eukprot:scaffold5269_cov255-Prasinococcus_capsulatus_cf.AAC.3
MHARRRHKGLLPAAVAALFPDYHAAVVGAARQHSTILRMGPRHLPNGTFMAVQVCQMCVRAVGVNLKDLYCTIRGARREALAVIVKLAVVNHIGVARLERLRTL